MKQFQLGYCAPRLIVLVALLDVCLRFAPQGWRLYAGGEREVSHRVLGDAFERNLTMIDAGYGDLIHLGNFHDGEERRSMTFSTDAFGFRSTGGTQPMAGIVFGDSFAFSGDTDADTLAAQVGRRIGCRVYNAAGRTPEFEKPSAREVKAVAARVGLDSVNRGVVIVERVERLLVDGPSLEEGSERERRARMMDSARSRVPGFSQLVVFADQLRRRTRTSSVELLAEDAMRSLKDGRVLPNSYAANVTQGTLRNGDRMLFFPGEFRAYERSWPLSTGYWVQLDRELKDDHLQLLVVLVPNKYTVYHRLLAEGPAVAVSPGELPARLARELRSRGIPAVDLTDALTSAAEQEYARRQYIYWREDTHWNARAVAVAAAEVGRAMPGASELCR